MAFGKFEIETVIPDCLPDNPVYETPDWIEQLIIAYYTTLNEEEINKIKSYIQYICEHHG